MSHGDLICLEYHIHDTCMPNAVLPFSGVLVCPSAAMAPPKKPTKAAHKAQQAATHEDELADALQGAEDEGSGHELKRRPASKRKITQPGPYLYCTV